MLPPPALWRTQLRRASGPPLCRCGGSSGAGAASAAAAAVQKPGGLRAFKRLLRAGCGPAVGRLRAGARSTHPYPPPPLLHRSTNLPPLLNPAPPLCCRRALRILSARAERNIRFACAQGHAPPRLFSPSQPQPLPSPSHQSRRHAQSPTRFDRTSR